jgi:hypothetical protein
MAGFFAGTAHVFQRMTPSAAKLEEDWREHLAAS